MRIVLFGAGGNIARRIAREALGRGAPDHRSGARSVEVSAVR